MAFDVGAAQAATSASRGLRRSHMGAFVAVFALAFLGSWLLWTNPGYFSHDELQWASFAGNSGPIQWVPWLDVASFQYRPLTFNLWLWLSRHLFDTPQLFHALLVGWGAANAGLACVLARRLGVAAWPAAIGALVFALGPYAAYVHGWIGTIGDLAWVSCALLVALLVAGGVRAWLLVAGTLLLTTAALLAKEAAVVIPAILGVAWLCLAGAAQAATPLRRRVLVATIAAAIVVIAYLALRLPVLLHAPDGAAAYQVDPAQVPRHWLEYQLFPFLPPVFEIFNTLARGFGGSLALAGLLWLGVVAACWRAHARLALFFLLGGAAALAPVLPMSAASNQYGYGFAALATLAAAAAWARAPRWARVALALAALACVWHGVNVMRTTRYVGNVQAVFSPALADAVRAETEPPLRLRVATDADEWIFRRLTFEIPSYRGVAIDDRVQLVPADAPADAVIQRDGRITPL